MPEVCTSRCAPPRKCWVCSPAARAANWCSSILRKSARYVVRGSISHQRDRHKLSNFFVCIFFHFHLIFICFFLSIVHFSFGATGYCGNVFILQTDDTQESGEVDEFVVDEAADWKGDKGHHFFGNIWSSISYSLSAGLGNIRRYGMTNEWTHASSGEKFNEEIRSEPSADARLVKKSSGSLPPRSHPGTSGTAPFKEQKKKKFQHYIFFVIGPCPLFSVGHFSLAGRGVKQKER